MSLDGGCHCGAIRYTVRNAPAYTALCHCSDCRKSSGAPVVAWAAYRDEDFAVTRGTATTRNSSGQSMRSFCPECGTQLWFRNAEHLPGIIDIQTATLDDPEVVPPQCHIQVAERIGWMTGIHDLPEFNRFPEG